MLKNISIKRQGIKQTKLRKQLNIDEDSVKLIANGVYKVDNACDTSICTNTLTEVKGLTHANKLKDIMNIAEQYDQEDGDYVIFYNLDYEDYGYGYVIYSIE